MNIHDIHTTRRKAAAILSGRKLQMLEDAGLMVVEVDLLKRLAQTMLRAPWPHRIDNDEYTRWYNHDLDPVWAEMEKVLNENEKARLKREAMKQNGPTRTD